MKQGRNLEQLARDIAALSDCKRDVIADTRQITMVLGGQSGNLPTIRVNGDSLTPTDHCHRQIATWSGIGTRYYNKMRDDSPALLAGNVNHWLHKEPEKGECRRMVRGLGSVARAFLSDRYLRLDNEHVFETSLKALEAADDVKIASCDLTESHMHIKAVFPRTTASVTVGDDVQAGVYIGNSETGQGSFVVYPFTYRLVCENGMVRMVKSDAGIRRRHLGARAERDGVIYQQDTIQAAAEAALLECRDAVRTFSSPDYFAKQVADMQKAADSKPVERPARAVVVLAKVVGLTDGESESVLERFIRGGDYSKWGMLNAVTNLANDADEYQRATELEQLGGQILNMTIPQWEKVAVAA